MGLKPLLREPCAMRMMGMRISGCAYSNLGCCPFFRIQRVVDGQAVIGRTGGSRNMRRGGIFLKSERP